MGVPRRDHRRSATARVGGRTHRRPTALHHARSAITQVRTAPQVAPHPRAIVVACAWPAPLIGPGAWPEVRRDARHRLALPLGQGAALLGLRAQQGAQLLLLLGAQTLRGGRIGPTRRRCGATAPPLGLADDSRRGERERGWEESQSVSHGKTLVL